MTANATLSRVGRSIGGARRRDNVNHAVNGPVGAESIWKSVDSQ